MTNKVRGQAAHRRAHEPIVDEMCKTPNRIGTNPYFLTNRLGLRANNAKLVVCLSHVVYTGDPVCGHTDGADESSSLPPQCSPAGDIRTDVIGRQPPSDGSPKPPAPARSRSRAGPSGAYSGSQPRPARKQAAPRAAQHRRLCLGTARDDFWGQTKDASRQALACVKRIPEDGACRWGENTSRVRNLLSRQCVTFRLTTEDFVHFRVP